MISAYNAFALYEDACMRLLLIFIGVKIDEAYMVRMLVMAECLLSFYLLV